MHAITQGQTKKLHVTGKDWDALRSSKSTGAVAVCWFHSVLTSESAQAEAVLTPCRSARWDGTEAWAHPTYPELPAADPSRCRLLIQSAGEREEAQTQLLPSRANAGTPTPGVCSGEPPQSPRAASAPPRPQQSPAAQPPLAAPGALPRRWAPPATPPPAPLTPRRPWRGDHRPERSRRRQGKRQERGGKRRRRCRGASPPAPTWGAGRGRAALRRRVRATRRRKGLCSDRRDAAASACGVLAIFCPESNIPCR